MKGEFSHSSKKFMTVLLAGFFIPVMICGGALNINGMIILSCIGFPVVLAGMIFFDSFKSTFTADDYAVCFRIGRHEYTVRYVDIEDIRCNVKLWNGKYSSSYHMELTVKTAGKTYRFNDKLNTPQDEHCFTELCEYVKERMGR